MVASDDDFLGDSSGVARLDVLLFKIVSPFELLESRLGKFEPVGSELEAVTARLSKRRSRLL
ncbi:MAG: hypothetical protein HC860_25875 [Alkalinema sp. RU_4_3]|nr:hypothetical protein [Alkalinema sp. RU_4_3]